MSHEDILRLHERLDKIDTRLRRVEMLGAALLALVGGTLGGNLIRFLL